MTRDITFSEQDKVAGTFMKWENFGDQVKGTLVGKRQKTDNYNPEQTQMIYEIKDLNDNIVLVGGKSGIDMQMKHVKLGQILSMVYENDIPPQKQGMHPTKIIQVYTRSDAMDEEWLKQREEEMAMTGEDPAEGEGESTSDNQGTIQPEETPIKEPPFADTQESQQTQAQSEAPATQETKVQQIKSLAKDKLGVDVVNQDYTKPVMENTGLAFIETNYDSIIEKLQNM